MSRATISTAVDPDQPSPEFPKLSWIEKLDAGECSVHDLPESLRRELLGTSISKGDVPLQLMPPPPSDRPYPYEGMIVFQGIPVCIETAAGSHRSGVDRNGKPWSIRMSHHYGEIPGTNGADGDPVDVYVGPDANAPIAYVLHQRLADDGPAVYDEDKLCAGFADRHAAVSCWAANLGLREVERGSMEHQAATALLVPFSESVVDGRGRHTESRSDVRHGHSGVSKSGGLIKAPTALGAAVGVPSLSSRGEATQKKSLPDRGGGHTARSGDGRNGRPGVPHGDGALKAPQSRSTVKSAMLGLRHDDQVRGVVVQPVPVDVVHYFTGEQGSTEKSFHDDPVFETLSAVYPDEAVHRVSAEPSNMPTSWFASHESERNPRVFVDKDGRLFIEPDVTEIPVAMLRERFARGDLDMGPIVKSLAGVKPMPLRKARVPEHRVDRLAVQPGELARRSPQFKRSIAVEGSITRRLEDGEYMMKAVDGPTGMRWMPDLPPADRVKLVDESDDILKSVMVAHATPETADDIGRAVAMALVTAVRNYDGTQSWADALSYQATVAAAGAARLHRSRELAKGDRGALRTILTAAGGDLEADLAAEQKRSTLRKAEKKGPTTPTGQPLVPVPSELMIEGEGVDAGGETQDPGVKARWLGLKAKAKAHGVRVKGKLTPTHTHEHLDRIEERLNAHIAMTDTANMRELPDPEKGEHLDKPKR